MKTILISIPTSCLTWGLAIFAMVFAVTVVVLLIKTAPCYEFEEDPFE